MKAGDRQLRLWVIIALFVYCVLCHLSAQIQSAGNLHSYSMYDVIILA